MGSNLRAGTRARGCTAARASFATGTHAAVRFTRTRSPRASTTTLIKPRVSALFPVTFDDGVLDPSTEITDGTLVCGGQGPTLYRGVRLELAYYFGELLVRELDGLEPQV